MPYYSDTYLDNTINCVNRALARQALASAVRAQYLTENCKDCNNPEVDNCTLNEWWAILTAWNNTDVTTNALSEEDLVQVIEDINLSLLCIQSLVPLRVTLNPLSQSITAGQDLLFKCAAAGGVVPYTFQWQISVASAAYVNISGATSATYNPVNVQPTEAGGYRCVITDAQNTSVTTLPAIVVVTGAGIPVSVTYGYNLSSGTDPYSTTSGGTTAPTINNPVALSITHNANLSIPFPLAAVDQFLIVKEPSTEVAKTIWVVQTGVNEGVMGDTGWRVPFVVAGFRYYITFNPAGFTFAYPLPVQLKSS